MEANKKGVFYKIKWICTIINNGLFWHGVRNRFAKIGLDFMPYFWELGSPNIEPPKIRGEDSEYQLSAFSEKEINFIKNNVIGIEHKDLIQDLKNGDTCLGIKYNEIISAYSFVKHQSFSFRGRTFVLRPTEGYVHNTYTFEDFRGKNLAPYLRYQTYEYLKNRDISRYYSISEYFNKSTLRYKQKLDVKPLKLYLSVILFKSLVFNFTLKKY